MMKYEKTQAMPLKIILKTFSSNPDFNGDCDFALVKLGLPEIEQIRNRMGLAKSLQEHDESFVCLEFWYPNPRYFRWFEDLESLVDYDALVDGKPVYIEDSIVRKIPEESYQFTEGRRIVVLPDSIYWECRPKHNDYVTIETIELQEEELTRRLSR